MIVSKGKEEGESLGEVRAKQAVAASHLAGRRKGIDSGDFRIIAVHNRRRTK